ncbi:MAG TPA: MBL fold metallo-hydrolase [Blastocatellia bacterium]|nr:MBL fold metallo-hydrolase [Blastocatellia bacterium]
MKRGLVLGALVVVGALLTAVGAANQTPSSASIQVDKVRDNLYVLRGGGGNTAAFITANGVTLVDTKVPGWGKPILEKLKEITEKPVTTIINTHTHVDHVGGNIEFPATVEVVTHENTAKLMREMRPVTGGPEQPNVFKDKNGLGLPRRTFKDRMTLGGGDERIELYYFGRAHTGGDAWVVFPALRVLHTGDAFALKIVPLIDANNGGSGVEYPHTIAKAVATLKNIDTVITGHNPTTLTMADLKTYGDFTREFIQTVQTAKKAGRTIDDVVNSWKTPDRFQKDGYLTPDEIQQLSRQSMAAQAARLRANVEVVWNETK